MSEFDLHAWLRALLADDPAEVVAAKCEVILTTARRWKSRRGAKAPTPAALMRVFAAYEVSPREQHLALKAAERARQGGGDAT